jgi:ribosomal protein S18 acetylase RimI-like enzyme
VEHLRFITDVESIEPTALRGFFEGWSDPPSADRHLEALRGSTHAVLAVEPGTEAVVGFITALSDGVLAAYIPLLEVRPEWRSQGLGTRLVELMLEHLQGIYMVDIVCDEDLLPFYENLGFMRWTAAIRRNRTALTR